MRCAPDIAIGLGAAATTGPIGSSILAVTMGSCVVLVVSEPLATKEQAAQLRVAGGYMSPAGLLSAVTALLVGKGEYAEEAAALANLAREAAGLDGSVLKEVLMVLSYADTVDTLRREGARQREEDSKRRRDNERQERDLTDHFEGWAPDTSWRTDDPGATDPDGPNETLVA